MERDPDIPVAGWFLLKGWYAWLGILAGLIGVAYLSNRVSKRLDTGSESASTSGSAPQTGPPTIQAIVTAQAGSALGTVGGFAWWLHFYRSGSWF